MSPELEQVVQELRLEMGPKLSAAVLRTEQGRCYFLLDAQLQKDGVALVAGYPKVKRVVVASVVVVVFVVGEAHELKVILGQDWKSDRTHE